MQPTNLHCLITGGAGFIGSHLAEGLLAAGHRVRVLDNFSTGKPDNLSAIINNVDLIEGDIRNYQTVRQAAKRIDVIFHQAAMASVFESMQNPARNHDINVNGTLYVLEAARQAGVSRLIFASSAAVYGPAPDTPIAEETPVRPVSPYGLGKHMGEQYCHLYAHLYGVQTVCFRYFNVYGPRQNPNSAYSGVISIFTDTILSGSNPVVYGDGRQSRDFVHVSDIVAANLSGMMYEGERHRVFNVASGQHHSLLDVLDVLQRHTGKTFDIEYQPERRGDIRDSCADITRIRKELNFKPRMSFENGLVHYANVIAASHASVR